jgi:hypothetical protein
MSFVTEFTTKSFELNILRDAADDWNIIYPKYAVSVVPSHSTPEGVFGFAYAPNAVTATNFGIFVEEEIAFRAAETNEEEYFPGGEAEAGWANIRADERAAVARQNREDAEYAARPRSFYHGVEGRWNPEDGWIYEP